ncbi:MAG: hypothetical protein KC478_03215 [Bacteriovoracaceae bacterium]|nr:hypothetical protein [Bacteriovoracaceae bacterium]
MGTEISKKETYSEEDELAFKNKLKEETDLLRKWFKERSFKHTGAMTGIELEAWLVDQDMMPNPCGAEFIKELGIEQIVPEISKFNFEINSSPYELEGKVFSKLRQELKSLWGDCASWTENNEAAPVLMGTLATLRDNMLDLENMSPQNRYFAINDQIIKMRGGKRPNIAFEGKDEVKLEFESVLVECAATSLQVHLSVSQDEAARYYNASLIASPLMIAISANSPYFFGRELWDESRIAVFEQAVAMDCFVGNRGNLIQRVTLGDDFVKGCLMELFEQNFDHYPVLLPEVSETDPKEMTHIKMHNGTIWRWNRPIIGENKDGSPHLRIEHRAPSAGPTIVDSVANTAFFLGLVDYLANLEIPPESCIDFQEVQENFYKASRQSYYCKVKWIDGKMWDMQDLLLNEVYPQVKNALIKRGIHKDDIIEYMDEIIYPRLKKGINGARWQKAFVHMHGKKFQQLMETYLENQKKDLPVHLWSL